MVLLLGILAIKFQTGSVNQLFFLSLLALMLIHLYLLKWVVLSFFCCIGEGFVYPFADEAQSG
jgi:hypothetical protein